MKGNIGFRRSVVVALVLAACATAPVSARPQQEASAVPLLVEAQWLSKNRELPGLRIVEYGRTRQEYLTGHIPGAVFLEKAAVWDVVDGINGMLPPAEKVAAALENAGIGSSGTIIVYDKNDGLQASRLFWALEYLGHPDVHILNGGLDVWTQEGGAVQKEAPAVTEGSFKARPRPELLATKQWVLANLNNPSVKLVDARSPKEFTGEDVRSARGGHIPGAINVNWVLNVTNEKVKKFLRNEELADFYGSLGISKDKEVVGYCQTGVRGAHTYFVLRLLGYPKVRVYDGSWEEWGNAADTPVVQGAK